MELWKLSGVFLIATGIIHTIVGLTIGWGIIGEMIQEGLYNSVETQYDRNATVWFLFCGIYWIMIGQFFHFYIKEKNKPIPRFIGWHLFIITLIGLIISPISGFWLFIPQAIIIIMANSKRIIRMK
ncbi:DUF6463 family protein [Bacillus spongiae]|uniref:DUF6463 family protein n=1 Tax=Bacillus spongiae TaxID=2683610 RepID=A0ABU8HCX3_9BACI